MELNNKFSIIFLFAVMSASTSFGQSYNADVEAKISMSTNNEFIEITGIALNKSEITQSLRYVLSVIKKNSENSNIAKNDQSGRIVLEPSEKKELSTTTINADVKDRVIILLLIYDINDNIVGKDRVVVNDNPEANDNALQNIMEDNNLPIEPTSNSESKIANEDVNQEGRDGIELSGIVTEDTKTKAGMDFYKLFYSNYSSKNINGSKVVSISEMIALGNNTKIQVKVDNALVWEFFARPKYDYLKSMADVAVQRVNAYFQNMEKNARNVRRY